MRQENPIIVQSNSSILLEVNNPLFVEARNAVSEFAHLEKSPEYMHTYSITPLSLWNAAALGMTAEQVIERLSRFSKYPPHLLDVLCRRMSPTISWSSWGGMEKSCSNRRRTGWSSGQGSPHCSCICRVIPSFNRF